MAAARQTERRRAHSTTTGCVRRENREMDDSWFENKRQLYSDHYISHLEVVS